jgi:excisionase family DNA binding protein
MREPQFLSIPEFCHEFKISRSYTFVLLRAGALKGIKVGKMTRIRRRDAQAWAAALPPAGRAKRKLKPEPQPSSRPVRDRKTRPPQDPPARAGAVRKWRPGGPGRPPKSERPAAE